MKINLIMKTDTRKKKLNNKINNIISLNGSVILVDKTKIRKNISIISKKLKNSQIMPVIKSEGYGIGAELLTKILYTSNFKNFFVGNINEGIKLRQKFKNINIYVLNIGSPINIKLIKKHKLIPVLNDLKEILFWEKSIKKAIPCIVHIDTGMNRLGINLGDIKNVKNKRLFQNLSIKFIMSHLACAEDKNNNINKLQLKKFNEANLLLSNITNKKIKSSLCNSSGIWLGKNYHFDIVRPGAAFLGINPTINKKNPLKETLILYTQVYQIRDAEKGMTVGYGASYKITKKSKLAIISIGYSYGLSRLLSNLGSVFIKDKEVNIIGRISMDLTVIDITKLKNNNVKTGTLVEIFGKNRTLENFAKKNNTIPYEVICKMARNMPKLII